MYELVVEADNKAWIGLHQEDERGMTSPKYVDLAIIIIRVEDNGTYSLHSCNSGSVERQVCSLFYYLFLQLYIASFLTCVLFWFVI